VECKNILEDESALEIITLLKKWLFIYSEE
jgi:hypothetical protein